jgi:hypothetical protein
VNWELISQYQRLSEYFIKEFEDRVNCVADHFVQSFIRFAGASYIWYDNIHSGTVEDR